MKGKTLLERIAYGNGDPQRTIAALRLLNAHLARELDQQRTFSDIDLRQKLLLIQLRKNKVSISIQPNDNENRQVGE